MSTSDISGAEKFVNYLQLDFWSIFALLLIWFVLSLIKYYAIGFGKKSGEHRANFDYNEMAKAVQKGLSESSVIGEIEGKLSSLDGITDFEETITNVVKNVEHEFWHKQQIAQLRRERLEEFLNILMEETDRFNDLKKAFLERSPNKSLGKPSKRPFLITTLYFPELKDSYAFYYQSQLACIGKLMALLGINYTDEQVENIFDSLITDWTIFSEIIFETAKGLTYESDSLESSS